MRKAIWLKVDLAKLLPKRYKQEESTDFDELLAPVARLLVIGLLCAFACLKALSFIK